MAVLCQRRKLRLKQMHVFELKAHGKAKASGGTRADRHFTGHTGLLASLRCWRAR